MSTGEKESVIFPHFCGGGGDKSDKNDVFQFNGFMSVVVGCEVCGLSFMLFFLGCALFPRGCECCSFFLLQVRFVLIVWL